MSALAFKNHDKLEGLTPHISSTTAAVFVFKRFGVRTGCLMVRYEPLPPSSLLCATLPPSSSPIRIVAFFRLSTIAPEELISLDFPSFFRFFFSCEPFEEN